MSYEITKRLEFDAGHRVPLHASKCKTPHGHRYVAEITCRASALTVEGFVIDFSEVKRLVGTWIDDNWDHTCLYQTGDALMGTMANLAEANGLRPFFAMACAPTAENMARHLFGIASMLLANASIEVVEVALWETPTCVARWRE